MHIEKDFKNKLTQMDYYTYLLTKNGILLLSPLIIGALIVAIIYDIINLGFTFNAIIYALPILLFVASYLQMYRIVKITLKSHKEINELKIIFTDTEYQDITNGEKSVLNYDKAYCYKETKNHFYIFVDRNNALIIPKREFNDNELNKLRGIFSKKIRKESLFTISSLLTSIISIGLVVIIVYNIITK